jgi:hypothetical protein
MTWYTIDTPSRGTQQSYIVGIASAAPVGDAGQEDAGTSRNKLHLPMRGGQP